MNDHVQTGDIWRDNDSRSQRDPRDLEVVTVGLSHAVVENVKTKRRTLIALERFKPTATGYRLISRLATKDDFR